ncbi:uncharacterized protein LOC117804325 [Ailuropoda melanoleuca]|uniref:uncharacterized protein LOC117804325 n=1 Tax=Ailuropoda melanoleuca TaxID=9646 RepID=UPI00149426C1|nr:uncharacterized protein LOC117804325 [Ailuropoda melanoleuca]
MGWGHVMEVSEAKAPMMYPEYGAAADGATAAAGGSLPSWGVCPVEAAEQPAAGKSSSVKLSSSRGSEPECFSLPRLRQRSPGSLLVGRVHIVCRLERSRGQDTWQEGGAERRALATNGLHDPKITKKVPSRRKWSEDGCAGSTRSPHPQPPQQKCQSVHPRSAKMWHVALSAKTAASTQEPQRYPANRPSVSPDTWRVRNTGPTAVICFPKRLI